MHHTFWISVLALSVFVTESESNGERVTTQCPVTGLHVACSSSNSVQIEWELESSTEGSCENQILNIRYFQLDMDIKHYRRVNILDKEVLIKGLNRDKRYAFNIVHYVNFTDELRQVEDSYRKVEATTHEVGNVTNLKVTNVTVTSAVVTWSLGDESKCVSHYELGWCRQQLGWKECTSCRVSTALKQQTLQNLTACTKYSVNLTAVAIDQVRSSLTASQTFTTAADGDQRVSGLKVSPLVSLWGLYHDGVTLEWSLNPGTTACVSHYQVSLRDQVKSLFLYNTTASTFTWKGDTCIIKSASVQAISEQKLVGKPAYILVRKQLQGPLHLGVCTVKTNWILALIVIAVVAIIAFACLVVKGHKRSKGHVDSKFKTEDKKITFVCERLSLMKFISRVEKVAVSESLLDEEYKQVAQLTRKITGTTTIARLPQNKGKNRYNDITPYDSDLVQLEGDEANSYINASHIKIQGKKSRHYIACQGPMKGTSKDFWKMVLQYKVNTIVMISMPSEEHKDKYFPYFPVSSRKVVIFGGINVYCTKEEIFTSYIIRYLTIDNKYDGTQMKVQHFHFTQWAAKGVPAIPGSLVGFIEHIRQITKAKHAAMAVHCSAGVGRTGTFIVVDHLLWKIRDSRCSRMSVPDTVLQLRKQRHQEMVQTKGQYRYIYKCLKFAFEFYYRDLKQECCCQAI